MWVQGEGPFATFRLVQDITMPFRGVRRNFSAYLYEGSDVISVHVRGGAAWEAPLVQGILQRLHGFAKVGTAGARAMSCAHFAVYFNSLLVSISMIC